jgi:hypothetical protein
MKMPVGFPKNGVVHCKACNKTFPNGVFVAIHRRKGECIAAAKPRQRHSTVDKIFDGTFAAELQNRIEVNQDRILALAAEVQKLSDTNKRLQAAHDTLKSLAPKPANGVPAEVPAQAMQWSAANHQ